jgi:dTDP-4-dehydrorhamnose 3,5-epimerase
LKFVPTPLPGAWVIELEPLADARGHFARTFCREEFRRQGLAEEFQQSSISWNRRRGTLRGMHYQAAPHEEAKIVRCTRGRMHDAIVELRSRRWFAVELSAANGRMLYVPRGFAHGFLTLEDDTEVHYQISTPYEAAAARGFRWNDPAVGIAWPAAVEVISERDRGYADLGPP